MDYVLNVARRFVIRTARLRLQQTGRRALFLFINVRGLNQLHIDRGMCGSYDIVLYIYIYMRGLLRAIAFRACIIHSLFTCCPDFTDCFCSI